MLVNFSQKRHGWFWCFDSRHAGGVYASSEVEPWIVDSLLRPADDIYDALRLHSRYE
jgi:hypothetical protein